MQKFIRLLGIITLIGLGVWGWFYFFPGPEKVIRSRLNSLAKTVSFKSEDGIIPRGYKAEKAVGFFSPDIDTQFELRGWENFHVTTREELSQLLLIGARQLRSLKVEFLDINVTLGADRQTAKANLTAKWSIGGSRDFDVQELNFLLKKVDRTWLIYRVETVKTLSLKSSPAA